MKTQHATYQYRLYPTKKQAQALEQLLMAGQRLYNAALEHRLVCWRTYRKPMGYLDQAADLKAIRDEHPDIGLLNFSACQQVLRRLDKVYREFVKGRRSLRQEIGTKGRCGIGSWASSHGLVCGRVPKGFALFPPIVLGAGL